MTWNLTRIPEMYRASVEREMVAAGQNDDAATAVLTKYLKIAAAADAARDQALCSLPVDFIGDVWNVGEAARTGVWAQHISVERGD
jgi:phytoene/squalene synthetase